MIHFLLFILSKLLYTIIAPIAMLYAIVKLLFKGGLANYFYILAFAIDQLGNVLIAPMANDVMLKKNPTKLYGSPDETISHVTGVNYLAKKLTKLGFILAFVLNKVDKNHVEKAANNNQNNTFK